MPSGKHERRRKGGRSSATSSSDRHKTSSSGRHHSSSSSKSHGGSNIRNIDAPNYQQRSRTSRREEEDAEAKRKVRESMRSSVAVDPASLAIFSSSKMSHQEDRDIKEKARRSTARHNNSVGGIRPGAYNASVDKTSVDKTPPRLQRGHPLPNPSVLQVGHPLPFPSEVSCEGLNLPGSESLDSLDNDEDDDPHFPTIREIDDQRAKLALRASSVGTGAPGAIPGKGKGRPSSNQIGSVSLKTIGGRTVPSRDSIRQSQYKAGKYSTAADPDRQRNSSATVHAMVVDDVENERLARLEEENKQLQREMENIRQSRQAEIVQAEEAKPTNTSKRTRMYIALFVFLAIAVGGGVAGAMLTGGSDDDSNTQGSSAIENTSGPKEPSTDPGATPTSISNKESPTLSPTQPPGGFSFDPPKDEDCVAMSNGLKVFNQTNFVDKNFTVGLDVSLGEAASLENFVESNLEEQLQSYLVPAVAGCPNVSRRRRLGSLPAIHRRLTSNYAIGNGIVKVACNSQVACQTLSSEICYQCLVDLQLFLKADITGLTMVIAGVMEQDLMELFKLDSPFLDVKASSIQAAEPTAVPSTAPTLTPSTHPSSSPSDRPSTKITGNQTSRPTPGPTPPPTPLPTPGLTSPQTTTPISGPTPAPVSCPATTDYFKGPWLTSEVKSKHPIGCGGRPTTLIVISPDDSSCVRCVGMLPASEYGTKCDETGGVIKFEIAGATSSTGETVNYGYASRLSQNTILSSCPDSALTLLDSSGEAPLRPGGGGGGGRPPR